MNDHPGGAQQSDHELHHSLDEELLRKAVQGQTTPLPPPVVKAKVLQRIHWLERLIELPVWYHIAWSILLGLVFTILGWVIIQPGVALYWPQPEGDWHNVQIERWDAESGVVEWIGQMAYDPAVNGFRDVQVQPWRTYTYSVLLIGENDRFLEVINQTMDTNLLWLTWVLIVVGGLALGVGIGWGARRYGQRWIEKNNRT